MKLRKRINMKGKIALTGLSLAAALAAQDAAAELVKVEYLSLTTLPDGRMRVVLANGQVVIVETNEFSLLNDGLYIEASSLDGLNQALSTSSLEAGSGGGLGLGGGSGVPLTALGIGAGVLGLAALAQDSSDDSSSSSSNDPALSATGTIASPQISEGTQTGATVVANLESYFENIEGNLTFTSEVTDDTGALVSNVLTVNGSQLVLMAEADDGNAGVYTVKITATDSADNQQATQTVTVVLQATDDVPTVENSIDDQTVQEGAAFSFTIPSNTFEDDEGAVTLSVEGLPDGFTFNSGTNTISGTATEGGTHTITVTATDSTNQTVQTSFDIFVTNVNDDPSLIDGVADPYIYDEQLDGTAINQGEQVTIDLGALVEDEEGDTLTFAANNLPDGFTLTTAGILSGTASTNSETITINVSDGLGGVLFFDVEVKVVNTNTTPTLANGISDPHTIATHGDGSTIDAGEAIGLDLSSLFEDADADAALTFTAQNLDPAYSLSDTGFLSGTAGAIDEDFDITVEDQ